MTDTPSDQPMREPNVESASQPLTQDGESIASQGAADHDGPPPATPAQVEQAEKLLRDAQIAKMRGQNSVADKLLQEAAQVAPGSAAVMEAIGDDLVKRGQWRKAKDAYAQAHKIDPSNAAIERKFGEMVLKVDMSIDPFTLNQADAGTMATTKTALLLNVFFPGAGHLFLLERPLAGGIALASWAIGMAWLFFSPGTFSNLMSLFGFPGTSGPFQPLNLLPVLLIIAPFLYCLSTSAAEAKRWSVGKIEKPVPPDNRDFEI
ncbi:MAG: tetratricopeptide repeat protein [Fimbriimonadaceae bacterium]|jgi:tetratricopeptide (TPR) repeat protein|nr:tetratricopeptide repeat protein [Fimbriimonadaceae bacterium]